MEVYEVGEDIIIVIYVPMGRREQKPVFINNDLFGGTFRRDYSGDYHCTKLQVKAMLRDQTENTMDMEVLDEVSIEDLNQETVQGYRNRHRILRPGHPLKGWITRNISGVLGLLRYLTQTENCIQQRQVS